MGWSVSRNTFVMYRQPLSFLSTIDIPLNPSYYHIKQLEEYEVADFEIVKKNGEYHAHISLEEEVAEKRAISIGGIDQGLNRTIAAVLLSEPMPCEELIKKEALPFRAG